MNKIAILNCRKAAQNCCGTDCLRLLSERKCSFAEYKGRHVRLAGIATCCGCENDPATDEDFGARLDHLEKAGVTQVHVSACVTSAKRACPRRDAMFSALEARGMEIRRMDEAR